jgi:hypothetical protein
VIWKSFSLGAEKLGDMANTKARPSAGKRKRDFIDIEAPQNSEEKIQKITCRQHNTREQLHPLRTF